MQPLAEKTVAYSRHLYDIASGTSAEFGKAAEAQAADSQKKFMSLVDNAAKNAPAGSETAVAVMKSAVSAANNAMESVQKAVKQATQRRRRPQHWLAGLGKLSCAKQQAALRPTTTAWTGQFHDATLLPSCAAFKKWKRSIN